MPAPDLIEPIIGFRAWHVLPDGRLLAWSAAAAPPWQPGVNTAICLAKPEVRSHVAPMHRCTCGLYALTSISDVRLQPAVQAVGAIVAWGEVELHATGFRAQSALIVALGLPQRCSEAHRRSLLLAAERYGVPLVPLGGLRAAAGEYGRMADPQQLTAPDPATRDPSHPPALTDVGACGIAIDHHLRLEVVTAGVRIALASAVLCEVLGSPSPLVEEGRLIGRDDPLLSADAKGGSLELTSPLSGQVTYVHASGQSLVELAPTRWREEARELAWGPRAQSAYAVEVAHAAQRGDPFTQLRSRWRERHAGVSSAADVLAALEAARAVPRFASERDVHEQIGERLRQALADPVTAHRVSRMKVRICWRLHEPDADLLIDLTSPAPRVVFDEPTAPGDLVLFASAAVADGYFAGTVDIAAALRRREIQSSAPLATVLCAESVLKAMKPAYAALGRHRAERLI